MTIFKCRKNPSEIIIRLNVKNNDKSALLKDRDSGPQESHVRSSGSVRNCHSHKIEQLQNTLK